jgi:hypothetical protein
VPTTAQPSAHNPNTHSVLVALGPVGTPPPALSAIDPTRRLSTTAARAGSAFSTCQVHFGATNRTTGSTTIPASAAVHTKCRTAAEARRNPAAAAKAANRTMLPLQALCANNSIHVMV